MRLVQLSNQEKAIRYGDAFALIEVKGVTYEIPIALPRISEDWRKRNHKVWGQGFKLKKNGRQSEKFFGVSEKDFYKLGRQLSKI